MNLPTFAIILEDHTLERVYGTSKVVHLVNSNITDIENHITPDMSGRQINNIYRRLNYVEQQHIQALDLFDETEAAILINQIELLNTSINTEGRVNTQLRELLVLFITTTIVILAVGISLGYYENTRQNDSVVESNIFRMVSKLLDSIPIG